MKRPSEDDMNGDRFIFFWEEVAGRVYDTAVQKGWHDKPRSSGDMIALIHSELSEALEGVRNPANDEHCPEFTSLEVELADAVIRIMDWSVHAGLRLPAALLAKVEYNRSRPYRHGGKLL